MVSLRTFWQPVQRASSVYSSSSAWFRPEHQPRRVPVHLDREFEVTDDVDVERYAHEAASEKKRIKMRAQRARSIAPLSAATFVSRQPLRKSNPKSQGLTTAVSRQLCESLDQDAAVREDDSVRRGIVSIRCQLDEGKALCARDR